MLHPGDGDLAHIAAMVLARRRKPSITSSDQERRGEWIWLRARAELVQTRANRRASRRIAVDISDQKALAEQTATANMRLREAIDAISEAFVLWIRATGLSLQLEILELNGCPVMSRLQAPATGTS